MAGERRADGRWRPPPGLTEAQREAVTAADPMLCVLAGAGAGKTRVLTLRVARRVADGTAGADHVLVCTFSRKAADELRHRLWVSGIEGLHAGTIHRTALGLLRQHRADHGLAPPVVAADRRSLLAEVMTEPGSATWARRGRHRRPAPDLTARRVDAEIGWAKARMVRPDGYERAAREAGRSPAVPPAVVARHYRAYEEARRRRGLLDLDDLLSAAADLLGDDPAFADAVRWRFRHLFVDEMQDVNPAQFRLLMALLGDEPDIFVVGDPNQSVYAWNGADPRLLHDLPDILVGTRVLRLDENHRCTPQVVAVAAAALGQTGPGGTPISAQDDGPVPRIVTHPTDVAEARWVARQIWLDHRPGRHWSATAVLARTNAQLDLMALALAHEKIPFEMLGSDTGPASDVRRILEARRLPHGDPFADPVDEEDEPDDGEDGDEGADEVPEAADGGAPGEQPDPLGAVVLSTFHRAKGLQWPAVYVIGLSEGLVPIGSARRADALAEERRLLYVALTRAEHQLTCTWARQPGDGESAGRERVPSRWLEAAADAAAALSRAERPLPPAEVAGRIASLRQRLRSASE